MKPSVKYPAVAGFVLAFVSAASADDLRVGLRTETTSIDPNFWTTVENQQIADHLFNPLVLKDHTNHLQPGIAVSWKPIDDKAWEFKIRRDAKWHDGSALTADDVIFSFDRAPTITGSSAPAGRYLRGKTYRKLDDYTVGVAADQPYPVLANELANIYVVSKKNAEGASPGDFNTGKAAIGTGPYKFVEWVKGERLVLAANPNYWGGKPIWEKVTFKPVSADPARLAALLSGEVDIINAVPTTDLLKLKNDPRVNIAEIAGERVVFIELDSNRDLSPFVRDNSGMPLWPNPLRKWEVRKAISKAIDRQAIATRVMDGAAVPAGQLAAPGMFGFDPNLKAEPYDPDGAKKLLAQVGYPNGFGLTLHGTTDDHPNDSKIAEAIAGMLLRVGIKTEVVTLPKAIYYVNSRRGGQHGLPGFSFQLYSFGPGTGEGSLELKAMLHTVNDARNLGSNNDGRYSNGRADALLDEALITLDDAKREKTLQEVAAIYFNDLGVIPLHYQMNVWALRKGLTYQARLREGTHAMGVSKAN